MAFFSNGADREKLAILYVLKLADFPLSREQIAGVLFEQGYENFIGLSERFTELEASACIATVPTYRIQTVVLTRRGDEIINLFEENLPRSLRDSIARQLEKNAQAFHSENTSQTESRFCTGGGFSTQLSLIENGEPFFEIRMKLPSAHYTRLAERRWSEIGGRLYFDTLLALTSEDAADAASSPSSHDAPAEPPAHDENTADDEVL